MLYFNLRPDACYLQPNTHMQHLPTSDLTWQVITQSVCFDLGAGLPPRLGSPELRNQGGAVQPHPGQLWKYSGQAGAKRACHLRWVKGEGYASSRCEKQLSYSGQYMRL